MEVVHSHCCGLDVHKDQVVACVLTPGGGAKPQEEIRRFGTMMADLEDLSEWLAAKGCLIVALESTGSFWKPIWNHLEGKIRLILVNPQHMKAIPGRKTDQKDCVWIAQLLRHGLLKPSFVPDRRQRELRELTRYRTTLIEERSAEVNRVQKLLEGANIKLGSVVSSMMGKSARAILTELSHGNRDVEALAALSLGRLRRKEAELAKALRGELTTVQRFLLTQQLGHIDQLDDQITALDTQIAEVLAPFANELALLQTIPGIGQRVAEVIVAELGVDMSQFPTAGHAAAWAGMAPGNHESAGKRLSHAKRKGNRAMGRALVQAAWAARRTKTSLGAQFHRLARTRGAKRAAVAVGHRLLIVAYHVLQNRTAYQELGYRYLEERNADARQRWLVSQLEAYGLDVELRSKAEVA
jgi:transposase